MSKDSEQTHTVNIGGRTWTLTEDNRHRITVEGAKLPVTIIEEPGLDHPQLVAEINGQVLVAEMLEKEASEYAVRLNGRTVSINLDTVQPVIQGSKAEEFSQGPVLVSAPMSGRVVSLNVSPHSQVTSGQSLVILEAMKMQNDISAPRSGIVKEVYVQAGALVKAGDKLCLLQ